MSSRFHNKWHRHNHHTNPTNDARYPDSSHDPIASEDSPFQGNFYLNGTLIADNISVDTTQVTVNGTVIPGTTLSTSISGLQININGTTFVIPLLQAS
jgi:hypothetical protein